MSICSEMEPSGRFTERCFNATSCRSTIKSSVSFFSGTKRALTYGRRKLLVEQGFLVVLGRTLVLRRDVLAFGFAFLLAPVAFGGKLDPMRQAAALKAVNPGDQDGGSALVPSFLFFLAS